MMDSAFREPINAYASEVNDVARDSGTDERTVTNRTASEKASLIRTTPNGHFVLIPKLTTPGSPSNRSENHWPISSTQLNNNQKLEVTSARQRL